ncbi:MAG TPA: 3-hydroxyacyl-CoA dehydrogenase family protein [Anaerovoracaceae bacterium]|nr:3-hydroxyacyl-CoA dehydrogenase family protein [Anaerovoracaceae bacterium]
MREIKKIVVAGAGTMGASLSEILAKFGYQVILYDLFPEALEKAKNLITINQETEVSENLVSNEDSEALLRRIEFLSDVNCFRCADFVIEAILEKLDIKHKFWKEVSTLVEEDVILTSNTSGLSITAIAQAVSNPGRFVGMHWINPPHIIPLIEIIKGEQTTEEAAEAVADLALRLKKKPVIVKDAPGFVLNRIQLAILRECLFIQERNIATIEAIDDVMKYGLGLRYACLGPFQVSDLGGLDIFDNIAAYLFTDLSAAQESFGLLKKCVQNKRLGVKNGAGFYDYSNGKDQELIKYRDIMYTRLGKLLYQ